jgi:hypothetical protein
MFAAQWRGFSAASKASGSRFVAQAATGPGLPLRLTAGREEEHRCGRVQRGRCLVVRDLGSLLGLSPTRPKRMHA